MHRLFKVSTSSMTKSKINPSVFIFFSIIPKNINISLGHGDIPNFNIGIILPDIETFMETMLI